jgi:organic hydroperoxide reductase OsmC/OhrA
MELTHQFRVIAWWTSGRTGIAKADSAPNAVHFAAPAQFGGLEGRWTPEDLLLSAVASCFTTTFQTIASYSNFEYLDLEVAVEGTVEKIASGYGFTGIVIRPRLTIPDESKLDRALELLKRTKALCLVARALGIEQEFEPKVEVGKAVQAF